MMCNTAATPDVWWCLKGEVAHQCVCILEFVQEEEWHWPLHRSVEIPPLSLCQQKRWCLMAACVGCRVVLELTHSPLDCAAGAVVLSSCVIATSIFSITTSVSFVGLPDLGKGSVVPCSIMCLSSHHTVWQQVVIPSSLKADTISTCDKP